MKQGEPTKIYVDNRSAIALAKNPVHHERTKHIDMKFLHIQDQLKEKEVELCYVKSSKQVADIFTKPLKTAVSCYLRSKLGVVELKNKFKGR